MEKTSKLLFAFAFLVLLSIGLTSALQTSSASSLQLDKGSSATLTLTLTNNELVNITGVNVTSTPSSGLTFSATPQNSQIINGSSLVITLNYTASSTITAGDYAQTIVVSYNNGTAQQKSISLSVGIEAEFCDFGNQGSNLSITDFTIINNGEGEDDDWYLLDDLEIEVEVSNNANKKISDVKVEIAIYSGNEDVTDDFDFEDTEISLGSISDDDEEIATFVIKNVPADIGEGDYTVKVKTYVSGDQDINCKQDSDSIQVSNPFGDGVVVYGGAISALLIEANAGDSLDISFDAINLDSDRQDEVLVTIYNKELGINEEYQLSDLRSGKSEAISFPSVNIPANAASKTYRVDVRTYFDYDDGDVLDINSYDSDSENDLEDDYNTFFFNVRVAGINTGLSPTISAKLNSTAILGQNLVVEATIKNNGNQRTTFILSADGYDSWATLSGMSQSTLTLNGQESRTMLITFSPTKAGQQTFNIKAIYDGKTQDQPITVNIKSNGSNFFANAISNYGAITVWLITAIVALVILILLIVVIKLIVSAFRR